MAQRGLPSLIVELQIRVNACLALASESWVRINDQNEALFSGQIEK